MRKKGWRFGEKKSPLPLLSVRVARFFGPNIPKQEKYNK
jgi:hypothetical protein